MYGRGFVLQQAKDEAETNDWAKDEKEAKAEPYWVGLWGQEEVFVILIVVVFLSPREYETKNTCRSSPDAESKPIMWL